MNTINDNKKCMASLAVFRQLCNQKKDVLSVLTLFVEYVIKKHALVKFTSDEIVVELRREFGFSVIESVVNVILSHRLRLKRLRGHYYYEGQDFAEIDDVIEGVGRAECNRDRIVGLIILYIECAVNRELKQEERDEVERSVGKIVLDDSAAVPYGEYISQFICEKNEDQTVTKALNEIREGMVGVVGLAYNSNTGKIDAIDKKIELYLDEEILFHAIGYNGELYERQFDEFYAQVCEVNKIAEDKGEGHPISLHYFSKVADEVTKFFAEAEECVSQKKTVNPLRTAMCSIVQGCHEISDVLDKKREFEEFLVEKQITEKDAENYTDESHFKYHIDQIGILEEPGWGDERRNRIEDGLMYINYISVIRERKILGQLKLAKAILITGTSTTLKLAHHKKIVAQNEVPLAFDISSITCRLWQSHNTGLALSDDLPSLNIQGRARMVLSKLVQDKVLKEYDKLERSVKVGKETEESVKKKLYYLYKTIGQVNEFEDEIRFDDVVEFVGSYSLDEYVIQKESKIADLEQKNEQKDIELTKSNRVNERLMLLNMGRLQKDFDYQYEKDMSAYEAGKRRCLKREHGKLVLCSVVVLLLYLVVVVGLFIIVQIAHCSPRWSILASLIGFVLPWLFPLTDFYKVRTSIKYLFDKSYRRGRQEEIEREYYNHNVMPQKQIATREMILGQLE